jgi:hypothetical protein
LYLRAVRASADRGRKSPGRHTSNFKWWMTNDPTRGGVGQVSAWKTRGGRP